MSQRGAVELRQAFRVWLYVAAHDHVRSRETGEGCVLRVSTNLNSAVHRGLPERRVAGAARSPLSAQQIYTRGFDNMNRSRTQTSSRTQTMRRSTIQAEASAEEQKEPSETSEVPWLSHCTRQPGDAGSTQKTGKWIIRCNRTRSMDGTKTALDIVWWVNRWGGQGRAADLQVHQTIMQSIMPCNRFMACGSLPS